VTALECVKTFWLDGLREGLGVRVETKRLLDRLGQSDFKYREYHEADTPSSTSRWPLFELIDRQLKEARLGSAPEHSESLPSTEGNDIKSLINRISAERSL